MLIRGFYKEDFLDYVNSEVFRGLGLDPEVAVRAVFDVMAKRLDAGEVDKLTNLFPKELRELWPAGAGRRQPA
jgi:uncharacterized protein (DUF2267 family)